MKGQVRASGQNEYHANDLNDTTTTTTPTSSSTKIESDQKYYNDHHPPPSNTSISQILTGVNDDLYRLFIVPLS